MRKKKNEELLIVKVDCKGPQLYKQIGNDIRKQRETGTIILPGYCEVVTAPKDIEIKVVESEAVQLIREQKIREAANILNDLLEDCSYRMNNTESQVDVFAIDRARDLLYEALNC